MKHGLRFSESSIAQLRDAIKSLPDNEVSKADERLACVYRNIAELSRKLRMLPNRDQRALLTLMYAEIGAIISRYSKAVDGT